MIRPLLVSAALCALVVPAKAEQVFPATLAGHALLPAFTLGLLSSSLIIRFTRSSMLDVLNDDYIRTARSKGMGEFRVVMRHAFKNALIPIVTVLGLTMALLVSGAVVVMLPAPGMLRTTNVEPGRYFCMYSATRRP